MKKNGAMVGQEGMAPPEPIRNVVVISAPIVELVGGLIHGQSVGAFKSVGARVTTVGDGTSPITLEDIGKSVAEATKGASKGVTIYYLGHGDKDQKNDFVFLLGDSKRLPAEDFFNVVAGSANGKPIDIVLTPCYGARALAYAPLLPEGSTAVAFNRADDKANNWGIAKFTFHLDGNPELAGDLSAIALARAYVEKAKPAPGEEPVSYVSIANAPARPEGKSLSYKWNGMKPMPN